MVKTNLMLGKLSFWRSSNVTKFDISICCSILLFCFFAFGHGDLVVTGNASLELYKGLFNFYDIRGGNYLISTYIVFAIWNFPLFLAGYRCPQDLNYCPYWVHQWFKLCPILFFALSTFLIYKIAKKIEFEEDKAKWCCFAFATCSMSVFSQFIFIQYDIFTVFFFLAGLYFYFDNKWWKYVLCFGIAITFKYHVAIYFLVLLVLKEKKIFQILKNVLFFVLPMICVALPFWGSPYFKRCVLGFGALSYVDLSGLNIGFFNYSIDVPSVVIIALLIIGYLKQAENNIENTRWALFLLAGVTFALFGCMAWNPQWLLMLVPILILNIFNNKYFTFYYILLNIFTVTLYIFIAMNWGEACGEGLLRRGMFRDVMNSGVQRIQMQDLLYFPKIDYVVAVLWCIILFWFILSHPKNQNNNRYIINFNLIRWHFMLAIFAWLVPSMVSLASTSKISEVEYMNSINYLDGVVAITEENSIFEQGFFANGDTLTGIDLAVRNSGAIWDNELNICIYDEKRKIIYNGVYLTKYLWKSDGIYRILDEEINIDEGRWYNVVLEWKNIDDKCKLELLTNSLIENQGEQRENDNYVHNIAVRIYGKKNLVKE